MPNPAENSRRPIVNLGAKLESSLLGYVTAASAAGVAFVVVAQPLAAEVVYTPANITLMSATTIDLNNDGIPDVTFHLTNTNYGAFQLVYPGAKGGALVFGTIGSNEGEPYPLPWLARIGPTAKFEFRGGIIDGVRGCHSQCFSFGIWEGLSDRYLGVRFLVEGAVHYGWVRISVTSGIEGTISGYAYETTPNKPIIAGKTSGPVKAGGTLPDLLPLLPVQSLGALARGADGIAIWRREEETAA